MNYSVEILQKAKEIHNRVLVLDTHIDINTDYFTSTKNYLHELDIQVTLPKMKEGGMDVAWLIVYTAQGALTSDGFEQAYNNAIRKFDAIKLLTVKIAPHKIGLATNSSQIKELHASGKKVVMIGVENAYPIGTDISVVKEFYDKGARYMSFSHNGHNQFCHSNTGEQEAFWIDKGLSNLGKQLVVEMNKLGMMIDVSHLSKQSMKDIIDLSQAPIIASHSSARALCDHSRNLDDEQLKWMKKNGGVVQAVAFSAYINSKKHFTYDQVLNQKISVLAKNRGLKIKSWNEIRKMKNFETEKFIATYKDVLEEALSLITEQDPRPVNITDFVDHIDYLIEVMGIDHVGISSDFDGGGGIDGWNDASETLNITTELVKRGYAESQITQLWSGNLLRVLDQVDKVARDLQSQ